MQVSSHQELGDRDPADIMDKGTCKCATCKLKADGCEKKEFKKCLKTNVKVENTSIDKKGIFLFACPRLLMNDFWSH